jgi:hypothetical protein
MMKNQLFLTRSYNKQLNRIWSSSAKNFGSAKSWQPPSEEEFRNRVPATAKGYVGSGGLWPC